MATPRILICGAGIAGSTLAYWLAKNGFHVVVVERSAAAKTAGQGIDIEGPALEIVKLMGLLEKVQEKTTREVGAAVVDEQNRPCAIFDVEGGGVTLTRAIEILRGDLAEVLCAAADAFANVEFRYETVIQSLSQAPGTTTVMVELEDQRRCGTSKTEEFDVVVGADGVRSRTRQLAMGSDETLKCLRSVGCYVAFFAIPAEAQDWPRARLCQFPGRRSMTIRPGGKDAKFSSVYLGCCHDDNAALLAAQAANDRQMAKEAIAELFQGLGWETERVITQMMLTDNFYSQQLMQVRLEDNRWSQGRVVLLGDAAYAPSPLTGRGTALAILGAYVLAQELSRNHQDNDDDDDDDVSSAFKQYENRLRKYVENAQRIPLGGYAPYLLNPETSW